MEGVLQDNEHEGLWVLAIEMLSQMFKTKSIAIFFLTRSTHQDCYRWLLNYYSYKLTTSFYTLLLILKTTVYYKYYRAL